MNLKEYFDNLFLETQREREFDPDEFERDQFDPDEIEIGDLVDFGPYGKLYVVRDNGDRLWVTDLEEDRRNPDASGWGIRKSYAYGIIEKYDDYGDEESYEDEDQLSFEQIYNIVTQSRNNKTEEQQVEHFIELAKDVGYPDHAIMIELVNEFGMSKEEARGVINGYNI